ncbi:MAG: sulfite exporter TauE/SafE family protein [Planctomycetota bacterium]|nr:MAG: sulfite exporter TauE/SafE family protein [Planctomycetota bacterium]
MSDITLWQWLLAGLAALIVGCAKTGLPGLGLLAVPLMAVAFGGRVSVGALLPMLIVADCCAVWWYRRHAQWLHLRRLVPWVVVGLTVGFVLMWWLALMEVQQQAVDAWFTPLLGAVIMLMLLMLVLRRWLGDQLTPQQPGMVVLCGSGAGVATFMANAAGPMMTLYLSAMGMRKQAFMGTNAWFFLLLNVIKVPLFVLLGILVPQAPLITADSLMVNLWVAPLIILGVILGRHVFRAVSERLFELSVLSLAALASVYLLLS